MPPPPSQSPGPLIKFPYHPSTNIGQSSYVGSFLASHPPPIPLSDLLQLRNILDTARQQASDRIKFKDANKANISERQALAKRQVEAAAEQVNAERKRKAKEEEERRERERKERERLLEEARREQEESIKEEQMEVEVDEEDEEMDDEDEVPLAQAAKSKVPTKQGPTKDVKPSIQGKLQISVRCLSDDSADAIFVQARPPCDPRLSPTTTASPVRHHATSRKLAIPLPCAGTSFMLTQICCITDMSIASASATKWSTRTTRPTRPRARVSTCARQMRPLEPASG